MPEPIPKAIATHFLGDAPMPLLMGTAVLAHLAYGGVGGSVLAAITHHATMLKGATLGVALWAVMQVTWLPFLGWGAFGASVTPAIAVATLVLHLVYGVTVGGLVDRAHSTPGPDSQH